MGHVAHLPRPPLRRSCSRLVKRMAYSVPGWGVGELWLERKRVVHHELPRPDLAGDAGERAPNRPQGTARLPGESVPPLSTRDRDDFGTNLVARLQRFFAGEPVDFGDVPLDRDGLSAFHLALLDTLRAVPRGEVVTYGELAALAGRPGAARAAGTFCAQNRFAVFVPCHRVVGAGGIGGYGSLGLDYKRRLLALERVAL
jgi:methylated-DNA-[protein]-cysteine S-methyltransferase